MRKKKVLLMMFSLLMVLILAACKDNAKPTESNNQGDSNDDDKKAEVDYYQTPEMDFDLGGKTIKIVSWFDMEIKDDNPDSIKKLENLEALKKKHNFDIEYVLLDYGEYQDKVVASLLAGEPLGDIVRLEKFYTIPSLVKQDLLWPIDEYTKNTNAFNQKVTNEIMTFEGRGYGFTDDQANFYSGIFYNRTLMNELGITPLQEYVDADNWNWDTFIDVVRDANRDTNNDGKLDVWGLAQGEGLLDSALYSNETDLTKGDQQNLEDPKTIEAFEFMVRIGTEELARPTEGGDWTEPSMFFRQGNTLMYAGAFWELDGFKEDMPDYDIGFLPFPKGPSATAYHSGETRFNSSAIPKAVDNPEQLMYIMEKIHDIESMYDYPLQNRLETQYVNEDDINNALLAADGFVVLDNQTFPSMDYYGLRYELAQGTSVSTVIEKYKDQYQAAVDEVYNQ
ncbi:ABC transporter substrate-binding protein [Lederbergia graminis]|uniref:ABC transporter substrate-binding protein n=1 Tax=Lederbergia graminis TaxID=735518 RepID=A0ABW0LP30_9BACI